jgi:hypothetical protein
MEAVGRYGLSDYTIAMTDSKCEEVVRQQLLMDQMDHNSYHTHMSYHLKKEAKLFRNTLVCKPWEDEKCAKQSDLYLDVLMLASALGTVAQWHMW